MAGLRVSHIGICVSDWRRSLRFYHDLLGFEYVSELDVAGEPGATLLQIEAVALHAVYLEREGVRIELLHFEKPGHLAGPRPRPVNQLGLTHLSLRVEDLDAFLTTLVAAGAEVLTHTRVGGRDARVKAVFVADPDGTLIELVQQLGV